MRCCCYFDVFSCHTSTQFGKCTYHNRAKKGLERDDEAILGKAYCLTSAIPLMYADDTNLTGIGTTCTEIEGNLNLELENINEWLLANKLTLNMGKTEYMVIGSKQRLKNMLEDYNVKLGESKLQTS